MALKNCKECGKEVSTKADKCPNCGAPVKAQEIGCFTSFFIICAILFVIGLFSGEDKSGANKPASKVDKKPAQKPIAKPVKPVDLRLEKIEKQFSAWDGSHRELENLIKETMNDPDSYEHDKTVYWDKGDHLVVKAIFRGKNAFGGVVRNSVTAKVGLNGVIIEILEE